MNRNISFKHDEREQAENRKHWAGIPWGMAIPIGHHKAKRAKNRTARKSRKANRK